MRKNWSIKAECFTGCLTVPRGLTVRIAGFHPAGPGSTPGVGTNFKFVHLLREGLSFLD